MLLKNDLLRSLMEFYGFHQCRCLSDMPFHIFENKFTTNFLICKYEILEQQV